jgi:hypothetical protein
MKLKVESDEVVAAVKKNGAPAGYPDILSFPTKDTVSRKRRTRSRAIAPYSGSSITISRKRGKG